MKSFKQFLSESVSIAGDFNGNLYINASEPQRQEVGEEYSADIMWRGNLYRLDLVSKTGMPSVRELGEQLQSDYPGAVVQQIYPNLEKNSNIVSAKRYHPSKLEWID